MCAKDFPFYLIIREGNIDNYIPFARLVCITNESLGSAKKTPRKYYYLGKSKYFQY